MFDAGSEFCATDNHQPNGVRHILIISECFNSIHILDLLCTDLKIILYLSFLPICQLLET